MYNSVVYVFAGKLEATPLVESSTYYGPLVAVSILATLAIAAVIILSLILARKHGHNKAPITVANNRKAQSAAYDNPSYKVEIQQETMGEILFLLLDEQAKRAKYCLTWGW